MARAYPSQDRIAAGTTVPKATVGRVGRALREAEQPLWIRGGSGPGTGEHANNTQLVNLLIGVAAADPIASSAYLVSAYREAAFTTPLDEVLNASLPQTGPMLKTWALGDGMDAIVDGLTGPNRAALRRQLEEGEFSITLVVGDPLVAWVQWNGKVDEYDAKTSGRHTSEKHSVPRKPGERLLRTVKLTLEHFEMLAELWADTKSHVPAAPNSTSGSPNGLPEDESAASDPARGQNATAASDQPVNAELDGSTQLHSAGEKTKVQSPSGLPAGRALIPPWSSQNEGRSVNHRSYAGRGSDPTHACAA